MRFALSKTLSVIKEGALYEPEKYVELVKEMNVPLFIVNVEAPWEVLMSRFEIRIEAKKQGSKKIANIDPIRFKELYAMYNNTKMVTDLNFDSSKQSPEEIGEAVVSYIRKSLNN